MNLKLEEMLKKEREKIASLKAKYPFLFKGEGPRSGFSIGKGWMPLVENLCSVLNHHLEHYVPEEIREEMYVAQVKEKFGGLRFYMNQETPYMTGAIAMAEGLSYRTCESCGLPGKRQGGGYIRTLCDTCSEAEDKRKKEENDILKAEQIKRAEVRAKKLEAQDIAAIEQLNGKGSKVP